MSTTPSAPSRSDVSDRFTALLAHEQSREEVDDWACQWVTAEPDAVDPAVAWGLETLIGVESRHGPGEPYLFTDDQIAEWFVEYLSRCSAHP